MNVSPPHPLARQKLKSHVLGGPIHASNLGSHSPISRALCNSTKDEEQHIVEFVAANAAIMQEMKTTKMSPRGGFYFQIYVHLEWYV